ncbi:ABC transporter substrate-binding protein [Pseudomonas syringae]|uniref:Periplasmic component of an ABC superfamily branched-chain amino acid transporter n=1 Tax=Pseudomonas syringae pv. daphniphylli TaxID=264455 RepID=A0A9X0H1H2_PSESX|nr:ABC transporter substrate-binding protein [Pseudomonas syringae]KPX08686.1 Periplasmic component of an ABC superfamily branched-chain amino acid transporter [Pseudomonas syringae pv. daphniphylli]KWS90142.1 ABC transporter permease [Pseudomonas syringae pv. daphniphylli]
MKHRKSLLRLALGMALLGCGLATTAQAANEQYFPLQSYRVGPYAAGGTGFFGGFIDYLQYVNANGGVNGVKLTWLECETEYVVEKGVECYERLKGGLNGAPAAATNPLSVGIAYATLERSTADKLPLITINHGRTDSTDGSVFPYVFPLQLNPYSEVSAIVNYIGQREGGLASLKGKKIAVLYHGSPYGKETNGVLETLAKNYGFELTTLEVPLKSAQKVGFPVDHIIGNIWSNSEEDVIPAGAAAKCFISITTHPSGTDFPVLQGIKTAVLDKGQGNLADPKRFGTVYYNLGVVNGILNVEALRIAQARFGNKPLTGEQVRWGFEHLNLDDARLQALGAKGLVQPLKLSCADHEGGGAVRFQQWDGQRWNLISDWIQADRALLRPIIEASAAQYAKEKGITPRDCSKEQ